VCSQELLAQVDIKRTPTGFNLLTRDQDARIGRRAALELERQSRLLINARTENLLTSLVGLLAANVRAPDVAFTVRTLDVAEPLAIGLPGGPIYLTRGLLLLLRSEGEVAGVIAHEMAHIVLRHGTEQATRDHLDHAGIGALGGLGVERLVTILEASAPGAPLVTFSTHAEYEADALGAEWLASAGYEPAVLATAVGALRREAARRPSRLQTMVRNHPLAPDRERRIRNLATVLGQGGALEIVGGYSAVRARLSGGRIPDAGVTRVESNGTIDRRPAAARPVTTRPSSAFMLGVVADRSMTIGHPVNWNVLPSTGSAFGAAPAGGVIDDHGMPLLLHGAVFNLYAPFEDEVERWNNSVRRHYAPFADRTHARGALEDATDDVVRQVVRSNPWLNAAPGSARAETAGGDRSYSVSLRGRSPITNAPERVTVITRSLVDGRIVFLACVAPSKVQAEVEVACRRMANSVRSILE
jgi:hypothetical protein